MVPDRTRDLVNISRAAHLADLGGLVLKACMKKLEIHNSVMFCLLKFLQ